MNPSSDSAFALDLHERDVIGKPENFVAERGIALG